MPRALPASHTGQSARAALGADRSSRDDSLPAAAAAAAAQALDRAKAQGQTKHMAPSILLELEWDPVAEISETALWIAEGAPRLRALPPGNRPGIPRSIQSRSERLWLSDVAPVLTKHPLRSI